MSLPTLRLSFLMALTLLTTQSLANAQTAVQTAPPAEPADMISEPSASTPGVNHIRIVRLSQVSGQVRLDRNTGQKFEVAFINLPIVAGERLETLDGLAEVEFEDNSSIRLTPHTLIEFPVLERDASGATNNGMKLISGTLYASMVGSKGTDKYAVAVGNRTLTLPSSGHLRIDVNSHTAATLTVFKGGVTVADALSTLTVTKKKTLSFDPTTSDQPTLTKNNGDAATYDEWDKNSADYHSIHASSAFTAAPYSYGSNDLSYYGAFSNAGGCGSLWRPYLASAAWDPYGAGVWSFYPGAGYSWVSPYPWGWTPFHSGSWEYCGGYGWGWRPQNGSWYGLGNQPRPQPVNGSGAARPVAPHPPKPGQPTIVPVNLKSLTVSRPTSDSKFAFRPDSAGIGVPRGAFSNLGKLSQKAEQHSFAPTSVGEGQMERAYAVAGRGVSNSTPSSNGQVTSNHASFSNSSVTRSSQPPSGFSNSSARSSAPPPSFSAPSPPSSAPAASSSSSASHK